MSYTVTLKCGCVVYVACHPATRVAHTRVIETRGTICTVRHHDVGLRLSVWEPDHDGASGMHTYGSTEALRTINTLATRSTSSSH